MKRFLLTFALFFALVGLIAKTGHEVRYHQISPGISKVDFTLGEYSFRPVNLNGTEYTKIVFAGRATTMDAGYAELPFISASVKLSPDKNVQLKIVDAEFEEYQLEHPLVPSRGVIYRNQDPSKIPYVIAPESMVDAFYPGTLAYLDDPFIIKDVRGTTIFVQPFQWNAVRQILRVYTRVSVELVEDDTPPVNPLINPSGKVFREMEALYRSVFINYETNNDLQMGEDGHILVITTSRDEAAIQPYIDWKRQKGFVVHKQVVPVGTNVKTLVQQQYNANNSILYVLLVGDWADIKCDLGGGANAPMDVMLGCVVGTDNFPDIAIGRLSANSPAHVTTQVNKIINYEKNPTAGATWYEKAIGIGSNEGAGIGDDGEIDWQHLDIIYNYKLDPFTYNGYFPIYDPNATSLMVKNAVESGASIINYCGHGSQTSWGTTGFSNTNVNQLTNGNKLPFIFSVACVNGAYHSSGDCFAEAWMRKENGGAVMTLMSTINQPWTPPMRGQDYFNDLIVGGYNYQTNPGNGISTTEGRSIIGSIVVNGLVLMLTESNTTSDLQTVQTWITFGDPSMQIRTAPPAPLTISNNILLVGTPFETMVTSNGQPVAGALVALSQNGVYARGYTNAAGMVSIPNEFLPGDVLLVITAFNKETVYQTIQCIPPTGPYVIFDSVTVNDINGNNNGQLDYGETSYLTLSVKNVGVSQANNVQVTITSSSPYVTILNGTANFGNIPAGGSVTIQNAFTIQIANNVPNGQGILFGLTAVGQQVWESSFTLTAYAPILQYVNHSISDPGGNNNGKLDPGETANLMIIVKNSGNSGALNVVGNLSCNSPFITINQNQVNYGNIAAGQESSATFVVSASSSTPAGQLVTFTINITGALGITGSGTFNVVVGQIPVLIINLDTNNNSAPKMVTALNEIGIAHEVTTTFPANLNLYSSVFVCLGIYPNNTQLSASNASILAAYLNNGGRVYMEGGDTWYYDPQTVVHPMFGIVAQGDGSGDLSTVVGMNGTFTQGMSFPYNGDNSWIDRISAAAGATLILQNQNPVYGTAVAYNPGTYRTIGASHEFGGLNGDRKALMEKYLDFFGVLPSTLVPNFTANITQLCAGGQVQFTNLSQGATSYLWTFQGGTPNTSTEPNPLVTYYFPGSFSVTLQISNSSSTTSITQNNYITVMSPPSKPGPINGPSAVATGDITEYNVPPVANCSQYHWVLSPADAGTMTINMNSVTIQWSQSWTGVAKLKVRGENQCGLGPFSEEFQITVSDPTGISRPEQFTLNIYPNPTKGVVNIELLNPSDSKWQLTIVNLLGLDVLQKEIEIVGRYQDQLDLSNLPDGIYYLYLKNDQQSHVRKLILQK